MFRWAFNAKYKQNLSENKKNLIIDQKIKPLKLIILIIFKSHKF